MPLLSKMSGSEVIKNSTHLSMKFFLLINVKICWHFNISEQEKAYLSLKNTELLDIFILISI